MSKIFTSIFLLFWGFCFLQAQPITSNTFEQKLEAAQDAYDKGNYAGALEWYEKVYDEMRETQGRRSNPELKKYALKLGELHYLLRDYERAEKRYERVLRSDDDNIFADYRYMYAMSLKAGAKYTKALEEFNKLISLSENEDLIREAEFEIEGIELLRSVEPNVETSIKVLSDEINSRSAEYSPRETMDGTLYYASLNRKTPIEVDNDGEDEYHVKIYMTSRDDEGNFTEGEELEQNVNRLGFHNTHLAMSRDGRAMYYTRVQTEGTEITSSQILVSYKRETGWTSGEPLPTVNGDWFCKHPSVGQLFGRDVLFFVADMEGGQGDYDIYYSNINGDGSFSAPVNLGDKINTNRQELSPYYYEGTLYFSTNGHPTIGGFDIYYSIWDGEAWSEPVNMGLGYNSSCDDLFFFMADSGNRGYFVSNRPTEGKKKIKSETCCDDIFEFQIRDIVIDLLAIVVDEEDLPLDGATVKLENMSDPVNYPPSGKFNSLGNEFQFLLDPDFKYRAIASRDGYNNDTIEFNSAGILDSYTFKKKLSLKKKESETRIVTVNEAIRLDKIYYDFDDYQILPEAEEDLEFLLELMEEYPEMVIELSSHTDAQGAARYNLELSQKRAESARNWLIDRGVKKKRILAVGYGEKQILNKCKNRVPCTDEEHRINRRTEFKIVEGPQSIEITREVPNN